METSPDRSPGEALVSAFLLFAAGYLGAFALAFLLFHARRRGAGGPAEPLADDLALGAYMLFAMGAPPTGAFAIVTAPWPAWTRAPRARTRWLSAGAGFATYAAQLTGAGSTLLYRAIPAGLGPFAPALRVLLPGIAAGLVALALAIVRLALPAPRSEPGER